MGLANLARGGNRKGLMKLPEAPIVGVSTVQADGGRNGTTARGELRSVSSLGVDLEQEVALGRESRGSVGDSSELARDGSDLPISVHHAMNMNLPESPNVGVSTPHATGEGGSSARGEGTPGGEPEPRGSVTGPPDFPNKDPGWRVDPSWVAPWAATPGDFDPEERKN